MNDQNDLLFSNRNALRRSRRAEFSPIRPGRSASSGAGLASAGLGAADGAVAPSAWLRDASPRPAWHRSVLDRLQPELTRFRE